MTIKNLSATMRNGAEIKLLNNSFKKTTDEYNCTIYEIEGTVTESAPHNIDYYSYYFKAKLEYDNETNHYDMTVGVTEPKHKTQTVWFKSYDNSIKTISDCLKFNDNLNTFYNDCSYDMSNVIGNILIDNFSKNGLTNIELKKVENYDNF